jgi:hypothetical protein
MELKIQVQNMFVCHKKKTELENTFMHTRLHVPGKW